MHKLGVALILTVVHLILQYVALITLTLGHGPNGLILILLLVLNGIPALIASAVTVLPVLFLSAVNADKWPWINYAAMLTFVGFGVVFFARAKSFEIQRAVIVADAIWITIFALSTWIPNTWTEDGEGSSDPQQ
jgi:hypothetical protein